MAKQYAVSIVVRNAVLGATMFGGAVTNVLSEPWVVSGLVAAAIAVPIATLDDDDDAS